MVRRGRIKDADTGPPSRLVRFGSMRSGKHGNTSEDKPAGPIYSMT
jgi:hypothetical protein